jgi:oleandomycin transport system ATP-binding protein
VRVNYAIEATGLAKRFGETQALAGVDLSARDGSVLGVLGPNGAGKTTAVRILATLLRPDGGAARVGGLDVARHAARVRRMVGLTGQYASVDEDLTGRENLVLIGRLLDLSGSDARARARELLEWFDLGRAADRRAKTYSGGMRRRLDLAASLVGRPAVIFLDEPTTGLDPAKREDMWQVIRSLISGGSTVLLTTQYLEDSRYPHLLHYPYASTHSNPDQQLHRRSHPHRTGRGRPAGGVPTARVRRCRGHPRRGRVGPQGEPVGPTGAGPVAC